VGVVRLPQTIELDLPEADRTVYAALAELWKALQEAMLENSKGRIMSPEGDAILFDPVAEYLSIVVIPQLAEQADGGPDVIRPRLRVDAETMIAAVSDLSWHDQWLRGEGMLGALGLNVPADDVMELRSRVIRSMVEQLAPVAGWPLDSPPDTVPA
jgi:hypothetical protein